MKDENRARSQTEGEFSRAAQARHSIGNTDCQAARDPDGNSADKEGALSQGGSKRVERGSRGGEEIRLPLLKTASNGQGREGGGES